MKIGVPVRRSWSVRTRLTLIAVTTAALSDTAVTAVALYFLHDLADAYYPGEPIPWYVHPGLFAFLVGTSALGVAFSGISAYRTVTGALGPVNSITSELAEITSTDLGRRVPVPDAHDEIRELAQTINQALDRLEKAVERQRRFASDASHDLRSPLTAMRAQVEEALHYPEDVDWGPKAQAMLASLDRLQAIVADLLTLAKLDAAAPSARERIDLGRMVADELDRRERRVEVVRRLEPSVTVAGDPLQLARLLTNLMDNAERHATSAIMVTVSAHEGKAVLEVLDDGAGIAPPSGRWSSPGSPGWTPHGPGTPGAPGWACPSPGDRPDPRREPGRGGQLPGCALRAAHSAGPQGQRPRPPVRALPGRAAAG
nr:hypothetical protein GCM10020093_042350 [Planobispora longispora]